jgi:HD-like signal output (HDOD) protein
MTQEMILDKVKAFPPLDDTVNKVMAVCNDVESSIADLAKVVKSDPMTTTNILKAANSPLYGFSREIKSIEQAVSIFGMETVKGFAFSSFLQKKPDLDLSPYGIDGKDFASISEQQNAFVAKWYKGKRAKLDVLILPSFLMEIGKIVLASLVIEHGKKEEFKALVDQVKTLEEMQNLEKKVFGITNEEVTAILLNDWNFDPMMSDAIRNLNNPAEAPEEVREYAQVLQVVKSVITTQPMDLDTNLPKALELIDQYGLDKARFEEVVKEQFQLESV